MRIAIPVQNGLVVPSFEEAAMFRLYDVENGRIVRQLEMSAGGTGAELLTDFLKSAGVRLLLCAAIGGKTIALLDEKGILFQWGILGKADQMVQEYLANQLALRKNPGCGGQGSCGCEDGECGCGEDCGGCGWE